MSVRQQGNDVSRTHNTLPALSAARPLPNNNQPSGNSGINKSAAQKMRDFKSELWCLLPIASRSGTVAHFYKIDWNLSGPLVWTGHFCIILILIRNELNQMRWCIFLQDIFQGFTRSACQFALHFAIIAK